MTHATAPQLSGRQSTSLDEISSWILQYLASKFPDMGSSLHADMSFDSIGLDSLARVDLMSAMEARFGTALDPTLAYDFVTPGALSAFVWGQACGIPADEKRLMGV